MPSLKTFPAAEGTYIHDSRFKHPKLYLHGYRYNCITRSEVTGVGYWRCYKTKCSARIRSSRTGLTIRNTHSHGCNPINASCPEDDVEESSSTVIKTEVDSPPVLERGISLIDISESESEDNPVASTSAAAIARQTARESSCRSTFATRTMPKLQRIQETSRAPQVVNAAKVTEPQPVAVQPHGFGRGLRPVEIIGAATAKTGELVFLMKWENCKFVDLVTAREANAKCPQVVISYYEKNVGFSGIHDLD